MFVANRSHKSSVEISESFDGTPPENEPTSYYLRWVRNKIISRPDRCVNEIESLTGIETADDFDALSLSQKLDRLAEYTETISAYLREPLSKSTIANMPDDKLWHILSFVDQFIKDTQDRSTILVKFITPQIDSAFHTRAFEILAKTYTKWFSVKGDNTDFIKKLINQFLKKKLEEFTDFLAFCYSQKKYRELQEFTRQTMVLYLQYTISQRDYESSSHFFRLTCSKNSKHERLINRALEQIVELPSINLINTISFLIELKGVDAIRLLSDNNMVRQGIETRLPFTGNFLDVISSKSVQSHKSPGVLVKSYQEIDNKLWLLLEIQAILTDEENLGWQFISQEILDEIYDCAVTGSYTNELQRLWQLVKLSYKRNLKILSSQVKFGLFKWAIVNSDMGVAIYLYLNWGIDTAENLRAYFIKNQYEELLKSRTNISHVVYELQRYASLERYYWCQGAARLLFIYEYSPRFNTVFSSLVDYLVKDFADLGYINWFVPPVKYAAINGDYDTRKISFLMKHILNSSLQL